jgi:hypothetical protein
MLLALLVLAQGAQPAPAPGVVQARVTLRIQRAARASESDWRKAPPARRREIERKDEAGRTIVIRVIEHQ